MKTMVAVEGQEPDKDEQFGQGQTSSQMPMPEPNEEDKSISQTKSNPDIEKLQRDFDEERKKTTELSKRMLYLQSDFMNSQRQTQRRIVEAIEDTKLRYLVELITVKEDLERAVLAAKTVEANLMVDGLHMLLSRVDGILRADEVERIAVAPGGDFDTSLHEAVAYSEGNGSGEGTIVSVVSNGYTMRGKVIKPALVEVSREIKGAFDEGRLLNQVGPVESAERGPEEENVAINESDEDRGSID